jgi:microcystin-dependent protein
MTHINQRRDTAANWTAANPVLQLGEVGWERDTNKFKLGDGATAWNALDYAVDTDLLAPLASPAFTGSPTAPTQSSGDNSTKLATTAHVKSVTDPISDEVALRALLDSPAFIGTPTAPTPADGDDSLKLATTEFIQNAIDNALLSVAAIPTGTIAPYSGETAPPGWQLCDTSTVLRSSPLGLLYGSMTPAYPYGTGDGSTTCNVPNLKGKVIVGVDSGDVDFDDEGATGGLKEVTLSTAEIPAHSHGIVSLGDNNRASGGSISITKVGGAGPGAGADGGPYNGNTANNTGGGGAHENMPPYMVLNYIVKL